MKNADSLGYEGRYETLDPVLRECFDSSFMAEKAVGRYWKSAGEAERTQLVETFARFTTANYAGRFNGYSGQHFEPPRVEPSSRGTLLARSRLVEPGGEGTQLNYRLRPVDGRWRIIDVYLNGTVSELALRRSEYSSMIKREGIDGLLTALQAHIDGLETTGAEQSL